MVRRIDRGNITAALYIRMADENLNTDSAKKKKKQDVAVTFQSGNDIIIQPTTRKDNPLLNVFINGFIGLAIGLLVGWFLLGPLQVHFNQSDKAQELADAYKEIDSKNALIDELKKDHDTLLNNYESLRDQINSYEGNNGAFDGYRYLLLAVSEYNKGDGMNKDDIAKNLDKISENNSDKIKSEEFQNVYNFLKSAVGGSVADNYYADGYNAFRQEDYVTALENFKKAVEYDPNNIDALYYLACTYMENKDYENARNEKRRMYRLFPGKAERYFIHQALRKVKYGVLRRIGK